MKIERKMSNKPQKPQLNIGAVIGCPSFGILTINKNEQKNKI
jgi:hypothetical protein